MTSETRHVKKKIQKVQKTHKYLRIKFQGNEVRSCSEKMCLNAT
jgi:hypothetical protein